MPPGHVALVERFGRHRLIVVAITAAIVAFTALPFANAWATIPIMCLLDVGLGLPHPLTLAWVVSLAPSSARGTALGMRMTVNRLAQFSIPLGIGALAGTAGAAAIFWTTAAVLTAAAVLSTTAEIGASPADPGDEAET